jgi:hypothetical protein
MDSAFQSLIENVSGMGLNDGDYLQLNNLLKRAYDDSKRPNNAQTPVTTTTLTATDVSGIKVELRREGEKKKTLFTYTLIEYQEVTHANGYHSYNYKWQLKSASSKKTVVVPATFCDHNREVRPIRLMADCISAKQIRVTLPTLPIPHEFNIMSVVENLVARRNMTNSINEVNDDDDLIDYSDGLASVTSDIDGMIYNALIDKIKERRASP